MKPLSKPRDFNEVVEENKEDREKLEKIYGEYVEIYFAGREFEKAIELANKFEAEFPQSQNADDYAWFKVYILRYFHHDYAALIDGYVNLIEKYGGAKFDRFDPQKSAEYDMEFEAKSKAGSDEKIGDEAEFEKSLEGLSPVEKVRKRRGGERYKARYDFFLKKLKEGTVLPARERTKEELEKELKGVKGLLGRIEELKGRLKSIEGEKEIDGYFEIGRLYREFNDTEKTEEWYLKGANANPDNEKSAEFYYELGNIYQEGLDRFPRNPKWRDEWARYDQLNENQKKAVGYYMKVYEKYPKSELAPKALDQAANLYTVIGWRWMTSEEMEDLGKKYGMGGIDRPSSLSLPDYSKSAELYEKIWKEYPGWEGMGGVLGKWINTVNEKGIAYYERRLEIAKAMVFLGINPYMYVNIEEIEELVKTSKIYKELYNAEPSFDNMSGPGPRIKARIKQLNELIEKKKEQNGGENK